MDLLVRAITVISPTHHQGTAGMIGGMLSILAAEFYRARGRVEENKRIRDLFRSTAPVINDPTLRVRLQELAATGDNDYRVSCS